MTDPDRSETALDTGDAVSLQLKSDPRHLRLIRAVVETVGCLAGFPESQAHSIVLAVDEGCANMMRHAYGGRTDGDIEVTCSIDEGEGGRRDLVVRLRDHGQKVDPARVRAPTPSDPEKPGGLGLHLMHRIMDSVKADPDVAEGNLIELRLACPR